MKGITAYLLAAERLLDQGWDWAEIVGVMLALSALVIAVAYLVVWLRRDR